MNIGAIGIQGISGNHPWGGYTGIIGSTGIGGGPPPICYGCEKITSSIKWVNANKWPEWSGRKPGTIICDKCYEEAIEVFQILAGTKPEDLPLFISHPNGFVRLRAANLLQKN
jgi:hypothetical protein